MGIPYKYWKQKIKSFLVKRNLNEIFFSKLQSRDSIFKYKNNFFKLFRRAIFIEK